MKKTVLAVHLREEFLRGDIISQFLGSKWKWPYWAFPLFMITSALLVLAIPTIVYSYPITAYSIGQYAISFIVQPFLVGYWLWFPQKAWKALEKLVENEVIPESQVCTKYSELLSTLSKKFNGHRVVFACVLSAALLTYGMVELQDPKTPFWFGRSSILWWLSEVPKGFLALYAISMSVLRIIFIQRFFKELYREIQIQVHPLDPDRAGGLASIGDLFLTYIFIVLMVIVFVISCILPNLPQYLAQDYIPFHFMLQLIMLPFFEIFVFFGMLFTTHRVMQSQYQLFLRKISEEFDHELQKLNKDKDLLPTIKAHTDLYSFFQHNYPTWPINLETLRGFFTTFSASVLPLLFPLLQNSFLNFLDTKP